MARKRLQSDDEEANQIELAEKRFETMNDDGDIQLVDDIDMFSMKEPTFAEAGDKEDGGQDFAVQDDTLSAKGGGFSLEDSQRIHLVHRYRASNSLVVDSEQYKPQNILLKSSLSKGQKQEPGAPGVQKVKPAFSSLRPMQAKRPPVPRKEDPRLPKSLQNFQSLQQIVFQDYQPRTETKKVAKEPRKNLKGQAAASETSTSSVREKPSFWRSTLKALSFKTSSQTESRQRPQQQTAREDPESQPLSFRNLFKMFPKAVKDGIREQFKNDIDFDEGLASREKIKSSEAAAQSHLQSLETVSQGTIPAQIDLTSLNSLSKTSHISTL